MSSSDINEALRKQALFDLTTTKNRDAADEVKSLRADLQRLLRERLKLSEDKLKLTFQSRFGRAEWLQPYTDKTVEALARSGVKNLAVVTPGFAADCLETLEEIAMEAFFGLVVAIAVVFEGGAKLTTSPLKAPARLVSELRHERPSISSGCIAYFWEGK